MNEYIAAQPRPTQRILRRVRRLIREAVPKSKEVISYQIPAVRTAAGVVLYFAAWKRHYSLYPVTKRLQDALKDDLAPYEKSKGTIRFPLAEPVPARLIKRIAKLRAREVAGRAKARTTKARTTKARTTKLAAFLIVFALSSYACANVNGVRGQADRATERFHEEFNHGRFAAIYGAADPAFRKSISAERFEASLQPVFAQLGSFQRVVRPGKWVMERGLDSSVVTAIDDGAFDRGFAQETFVWRVAKNGCTLIRYSIGNVKMRPAAVQRAQAATRPVRFVPVRASVDHLRYLAKYYAEQLGLEIEILPELTVDPAAWNAVRRQFSAEGLGEQVRQAIPNDNAIVIGITGDDMYLRSSRSRFWFSWRLDDRVAVVSYARMDPRFFGRTGNVDVLRTRLRHMVTKDLGLMVFGLEPSPDPDSPVYRDIGGIEELDAMGDDLELAGFPTVRR